MTRLAIVLVLLSFRLSTADVKLDPVATTHREAAYAAFDRFDYAQASRELEAAYKIDASDPSLLYEWGQSLRLGGQYAEAIDKYERYLATQPSDKARADTELKIAACRSISGGLAAVAAKDFATAARIFETAHHDDPLDPRLLLLLAQAQAAGDNCPAAIATYRRFLDAKIADDQRATATAGIASCERRPEKPPPRPARSPWYTDKLGGGLVGGGIVALAGGATFLVLSQRSKDAANRAEQRADFVDLLEEATSRRRLGAVGIGLGATLVVTGVIRYAIRKPGQVEVAITSSHHGATVLAMGRF